MRAWRGREVPSCRLFAVRRLLHALFLCLALLGFQQQLAAHAYAHLANARTEGLAAPGNGAACATCEILASGSNGVSAFLPEVSPACADGVVASGRFFSRAAAAPACYRSRAPPAHS